MFGSRPLLLGLMLATLSAHMACAPQSQQPPNVLLIVIDTLRQDRLGCYGWKRDTTPAIDALAARGVRFDRAYSTSSWTTPAVASILTGLYPSSHGALNMFSRLPDEAITLAEILDDNGYATAGIVSNILASSRFNFHQGHALWNESEAGEHDHISTPGVTAQAEAGLRYFAQRPEPFFLYLLFYDPHYDYLPHSQYGFAAPRAGRLDGSESIQELRALAPDLSPEELQFIQDLYEEEIRFTDEGIGRVLATLRELQLEEDTLIVLTADHGEEFMTHGWLGHTRTLYDELVKVPLIMRLPGKPEPRVVDKPVSIVSIVPTILDLVGLGETPARFQGPSLTPLLEGAAATGPGEAFAEVDFIPLRPDNLIKKTHKKALATERYKLIRDDETGRVELYDLESDPQELVDLAATRPGLVQQLMPRLEAGIALARGARLGDEELMLSDEEVERLRSLGYVGQ